MKADPTPSLILRHRPRSFAEVRGHDGVVEALQRRLGEPGPPHSYLLTGPSGIGKTTIARLIGDTLAAEIIEVDAASNSGVEAMRDLVDIGAYFTPGAGARMIILDECHRLSRNAWDAALKSIEEPSQGLYWGLCTTEPARLPQTVVTRCHPLRLGKVSEYVIQELLVHVIETEGWEDTVLPEVFSLVAEEADGSPRQALSLLQACYDAPNLAVAQRAVALHGNSTTVAILQIIMRGGDWTSVQPLIGQLNEDDFAEGAIIQACRYVCGALNRETDPKRARKHWELLSAMLYPAHGFDSRSIFIAAVGRMLWGEV